MVDRHDDSAERGDDAAERRRAADVAERELLGAMLAGVSKEGRAEDALGEQDASPATGDAGADVPLVPAVHVRSDDELEDLLFGHHDRSSTDATAPTELADPVEVEFRPATLEEFLAEEDPLSALADLLSWCPPGAQPRSVNELRASAAVMIARLGESLSEAVDSIVHHPAFQRLEASWRGLELLVDECVRHERTKVRMLDVSWREASLDLERAVDFDQSHLFRKVYTDEFDMPGGEPYGLLVGDFYLGGERSWKPGGGTYKRRSPLQDVRTLEHLSRVAAAAFAPVILGVAPEFFGLDDLGELERPIDLARVFEQPEFLAWRELRRTEDARFVGLALPRILMRRPRRPHGSRIDGFPYRERTPRRTDYLWGNASFAFGGIVLRDFGQSGWTGAIRGVERDSETGGIVSALVSSRFWTDTSEGAVKQSVEVQLSDHREKQLSDLGFLPLSHCPQTPFSAFHGSSSIQHPERYDDPVATINARISSLVQSILCVSRFAHYLKVIGREKVGSFQTADQCQSFLNNWLVDFCTVGDDLSPEVKARYPLREGRVEVRDLPGRAGVFACTVHLRPHYQLDQLTAAIRLTTELAPSRTS